MDADVKKKPVKPGGTFAVAIRPGVTYFQGGKVTGRFEQLARDLLARRARVYRALAK